MGHTGNRGLRIAAAPLAITTALAIAGCGERKEDTGTATSPKAPARPAKVTAAGASGATQSSVLACLKRKGLKVSRSGGRGGAHLEIRTSGGGTVSVYVYRSAAEARRRREAIAVGSKTSGGGVSQIGNALTVGSQGAPADVAAKVGACIRA